MIRNILFIFLGIFSLTNPGISQKNPTRCGQEHQMQKWFMKMPEQQQSIDQGFEEFNKNRSNIRQMGGVIAVHVIIVHPAGQAIGQGQNFSIEHVQSQIDVLNEDFGRYNGDAGNTPSVFPAEDTGIQFCLATVDPNGNPTDGITRYAFNGDFDNNEFDIKQATRWDRNSYLNIWSAPGISALGYAYLPSLSTLPNAVLDGVVVNADAFGGPGFATFVPYNLGRTATHEVGHFLGMRHIWQSNGCSADDGMSDTPVQDDENFGCPNHPSPSCSNSGDMFMNYMDYVNDNCMNAFTPDQGAYMRAILNGVRSSLLGASNSACAQIDPLVITVTGQDVSCFGADDGQILVEVSGGIPPYDISLSNGMNSMNGEFLSLPAGTYTVEVTDQSNQIAEETITISEPQELIITIESVTDNLCFEDFGGEIVVSADGGTNLTGYLFILNGMTQNNTGTFSNLPNGAYNIIVSDDNGCEAITEVDINSPDALQSVFTPTSIVSCFGENNAGFTVTGVGGSGNYVYSFNNQPFSSQNSYSNLGAGTYTVIVGDGNGCLFQNQYTITQPTALQVSSSVVADLLCFGDTTGVIEVTSLGGTPPYQYALGGNPYQNQSVFMHLGRGVYQGIVRDFNGCSGLFDAEISGPEKIEILSLETTNPVCGMANGSIHLTVTGGTGTNYAYSLQQETNNTGQFTSLDKGSYDIAVSDQNDCSVVINVVLNDDSNLQIGDVEVTDVSCFGDSTGIIQVGIQDGLPPFTFRSGNMTNEDGVFENLPSGTYEILVTDSEGCERTITAEVSQPDSSLVIIITSFTNGTGQNNGSIGVSATGGTGPYRYSKDGIVFTENTTFDDLMPGDYQIWVIDSLGCISSVETQISSTATISEKIFSIYPNPGSDIFNLEVTQSTDRFDFAIYGTDGIKLYQQKMITNSTKVYRVDLSSFRSGTYIFEVLIPSKSAIRRKIVKI
ncbi:MAG: T9SS type A sorting domain-containing protein [Saprospiraceae bacterium]|nr:T9SS type A sorting domain-containing protein [Saprospiraceae bacterium]